MVYQSGRVLHRRANSYADLLPLDAAREQKLKERVSAQHHAVLDELRSGALQFAQRATPAVESKVSADSNPKTSAAASAAGGVDSLVLRFLNAKNSLPRQPPPLQVFVFQN